MHVNHLKVLKRFLFNGHTTRFHLQIQKLKSAYTASRNTSAVRSLHNRQYLVKAQSVQLMIFYSSIQRHLKYSENIMTVSSAASFFDFSAKGKDFSASSSFVIHIFIYTLLSYITIPTKIMKFKPMLQSRQVRHTPQNSINKLII